MTGSSAEWKEMSKSKRETEASGLIRAMEERWYRSETTFRYLPCAFASVATCGVDASTVTGTIVSSTAGTLRPAAGLSVYIKHNKRIDREIDQRGDAMSPSTH